MLIIDRPQTDPYFNLAAEEYLLKQLDEDCFMVWVNEASVIVGKHQNAFAEINQEYVEQENIPVIRRISGGGTVFHDPGNLNFSFIRQGDREKLVDFRRFTQPIIDFLATLGVPAEFAGKNDIRVNGLKISGNAEHVFRNKVLHHGTLLFNAKLGQLNSSIRGREDRFRDKAVKSVRSTVENISSFLDEPRSIDSFRSELQLFVQMQFAGARLYSFSQQDIESIESLATEKYRTWKWNFGYSPAFVYKKRTDFNGKTLDIQIQVKQGLIRTVSAEYPDQLEGLESLLARTPFRKKDMYQCLIKSGASLFSSPDDVESFVESIFQ